MLKSVQNLVNDARDGMMASRYGNHSFNRSNGLCYFRYHDAPVCVVNFNNKTVSYSFCGYEGAPSTTRTVRSYQEVFKSYREVGREQHTGDQRK